MGKFTQRDLGRRLDIASVTSLEIWIDHSWSQLGVFMLSLLCLSGSKKIGASMLISAFIAGLFAQID